MRMLLFGLVALTPLLFLGCRTVIKPNKEQVAAMLKERHGVAFEVLEIGSNYPHSGYKGRAKSTAAPVVEFSFVVMEGELRRSAYRYVVWFEQASKIHGAILQATYPGTAVSQTSVQVNNDDLPEANFPDYETLLNERPGDLKLVTRVHIFKDVSAENQAEVLAGLAAYCNKVRLDAVGEHLLFAEFYDEAFFKGKKLSDYEFGFNSHTTENFEGTDARGRMRGNLYVSVTKTSPPVSSKMLFDAIRTDGKRAIRQAL